MREKPKDSKPKEPVDPVRLGFGMRLASARDGKGMTQDQVAERFDINKATVSAWETGRGVPDALRLRALAKLYDVSADSLLWEDSLSPEAMKFAAAFDSLNETQKRTLYAMWEAYIRESATDAEVEDRMAVTKTLKDKYTPKVGAPFHPAQEEERERAAQGGED